MSKLEKVLVELRVITGTTPKITIKQFKNWAGTQIVQNVLYSVPETVEHVQQLVQNARSLNLHVRCMGQAHSWGPIFADEGNLLLDMRQLILEDGTRIKLEGLLVTAAAGVSLADLETFQLANSVAIPANARPLVITVGGVVTTGSHGTGRDVKTLSDYTTKMRIVDSSGKIKVYKRAEDPEMMKAVQCNLGLFGVILDVTFSVVRTKKMRQTYQYHKATDLFYTPGFLRSLFDKHYSIHLSCLAFSGTNMWQAACAAVQGRIPKSMYHPKEDEWQIIVTDEASPDEEVTSSFNEDLDKLKNMLQADALGLVDDILVQCPRITPLFLHIANCIRKLGAQNTVVHYLPKAVHNSKYMERANAGLTLEACINVSGDFSELCRAMEILLDKMQAMAAKGKFPENGILGIRFVRGSDGFLMPSVIGKGENGICAYISLLAAFGTPGWNEFLSAVMAEWRKVGVTFNWGKQWYIVENIKHIIKEQYDLNSFKAQLERSQADPDGMFTNKALREFILQQPTKRQKAYAARASKVVGVKGRRIPACILL